MLSFGQTRSARLAEKERKQREYAAELERQIEAKKVREQRERAQERQQSRELLSANKQRETVVPLGLGNQPVVDSRRSPQRQAQALSPSSYQQQEALNPDDASARPAGLAGEDPGAQPLPVIRAQDNFQPSETFYKKLEEERRKLAYGEELRQQMREQKERKERERKMWKFGEPSDLYTSHSPHQPRHDEALLKNEYASSFQESADAPAYLRTAHAGAAKPPRYQPRHDEAVLKSERDHSFKESTDAPSYLRSHVDHRPAAKVIPPHGEAVLKNEYQHAYRESADAPSYMHNRAQERNAVPQQPVHQPRHDDAILKSEIQHAFHESPQSPAYLRGNGDKRQPMVHFRSDYRDMTALEIEQKQKKAAELHNDLLRQMEEKKAAKQREKEERRMEEERENERIRREQEQLRAQFEGENNREHRSRRSHAAPFINLSSNEEGQTTAHAPSFNTPRRASVQQTKAAPTRRVSQSETMSHPSFSIPEKPKVYKEERVRLPSPKEEKMEKPATPTRAGLSTPMVEKKIASSVDSIRDELVSNQEKVIQVINEQRQALVAETESTRQEMLQMKNMLQEYQFSIQKMEQLHNEQMQMQNVYALMKESENDEIRQSQEDSYYAAQAAQEAEIARRDAVETPSWVKQAMKEQSGFDLMQSLQADSTLVFPVNESIEAPSMPAHSSPLRASMDMPSLPVVENGVEDLRLDSESNYLGEDEEWQHQEPPQVDYSEITELDLPKRNPSVAPSVASSVGTFNVEELYERNANKLKMLEDLEAVEDVDEIDRKLNQFLSTRSDSFSNPVEPFNELDYKSGLNINDIMEPKRLSTPCLPAESDWIR